jgi:hypothetical protein
VYITTTNEQWIQVQKDLFEGLKGLQEKDHSNIKNNVRP